MASLDVDLFSPVSAVVLPLSSVPDPVFSQGLVGDGLGFDPLGSELLAPCDGTLALVHRARHALTLRHASGLEVLMHVGLDTVGLAGEGFELLVAEQNSVVRGQPLLRFDVDLLARKARSLITLMVVTPSPQVLKIVKHLPPESGQVQAGYDRVATVSFAVQAPDEALADASIVTDAAASPALRLETTAVVLNPSGMHARPAAVLNQLARRFQARLSLHTKEQEADARSLVALLGLGLTQGQEVCLRAEGVDAASALEAVRAAFAEGLGDDLKAAAPAETGVSPDLGAQRSPSTPVTPSPGSQTEASSSTRHYSGVPASPGLAVGTLVRFRRSQVLALEAGQGHEVEARQFKVALAQAKIALEALGARLQQEGKTQEAGIFGAHEALLDDPELLRAAETHLRAGKSAAWAWMQACEAQARTLEGLASPLLAARAHDVRDVAHRVVHLLQPAASSLERAECPPDTILLADDLTPSDTASLDRSRVLGLATLLGGATSHVSILARSFGLPAVVALDPRAAGLADHTRVILDGTQGRLLTQPTAEEEATARYTQGSLQEQREAAHARAHEPAVTQDGRRIEVAANLDAVEDLARLLETGCDGVGLLRSEFLYLDRQTPPDEEEQTAIYDQVATALGDGRKLIVRTLDVGGDKPLPYLKQAAETNPFLGERGLRLALRRPDILRTQFRALLHCAHHSNLHVMLPMVTSVEEFREAKAMFEEERLLLSAPDVPLGIMIEVPSAALCAHALAREADFFSIGTNDLTQYTLAVDRGHAGLAHMADGLHPAVLRLIASTVQGAHAYGRWVGVCGGLASEVAALPLLIGLGVDELSVAAPQVASVKAAVRALDEARCKILAQQALEAESAAAVRALVEVPA